MKKALFLYIFFISVLSAQYTNRLPATLTLKAGENKTEDAIADCTSPWECIFNANKNSNGYSFTYNTTGATTSTLTLNAKLPQNPQSKNTNIPFYASTLTVNKNSTLVLNNFESLSIQNALNINGGSLRYSHTTNTSGFGLPTNARVTLSNNALFEINAGKFTNNGTITLSNQSTLNINTEGGNKTNNYGSITNNNSNITVKNDLWNLGQKPALGAASPSSVASLINNGGTITIGGNLYNGGQNFSNNVQFCQIGFCGGGNIIINGGTVSVGRKLISEGKDGQNSSIQIKGGTLKVTGGLENKQGSTLNFGMLNGVMGKLEGGLTNTGTVSVDIDKSVTFGQSYQIITGTVTGLDNNNIIINNPNAKFLDITYNAGSITISQAGTQPPAPQPPQPPQPQPPQPQPPQPPQPQPPQPPTKFDEYKGSLKPSQRVILDGFLSKYGSLDNLLKSNLDIENSVSEFDESLKQNFISQPQSMISAFKNDSLLIPLNKSFISKPLAAMELMRIDTGKFINPFEPDSEFDFFANSFGGVLRADKLKGYLTGLTLGSSYMADESLSQLHFSYAYGQSSQDLSTQRTKTKGNLLQVGVFTRYFYKNLESDISANALLGLFSVDNKWLADESLSSSSTFNNYQANLGLVLGPRFGDKASFKPFLGVQNYFEAQDAFSQKGGLGLESKAYSSYILDAVVGLETRYIFDEAAFAFAKLSYEGKIYNTHKEIFMRLGNENFSYENESYKNALSLNLGIEIFALERTRINAELLYKHYNTGLDYYGGNLLLKYNF